MSGKAIYKFRSSMGWTQEQIVKEFNGVGPFTITQSAISAYENPNKWPKIGIARQFVRLAEKHNYKLTLDEIYNET